MAENKKNRRQVNAPGDGFVLLSSLQVCKHLATLRDGSQPSPERLLLPLLLYYGSSVSASASLAVQRVGTVVRMASSHMPGLDSRETLTAVIIVLRALYGYCLAPP